MHGSFNLVIAPEKHDSFLISLWVVSFPKCNVQKTSVLDWLCLSKVENFVNVLGECTLGKIDAYLGRGQAVAIWLNSRNVLAGLSLAPAKNAPVVRNFLTIPNQLPLSSQANYKKDASGKRYPLGVA